MYGKLARIKRRVLLSILLVGLCIPATAQQVTLTFQYRSGGLRTEVVHAWIEEFEAENPDIKIEFLPLAGPEGETTLVSWIAGLGPDVVEVYGNWGQDFARAGLFLDLRPFVERDFTEEDINDFWPIAWSTSFVGSGRLQGLMYRIPRYIITNVYYYNEDHLVRAGLATPLDLDARGEWTYQALREMARKLTEFDGVSVTRYGFTTNTQDYRRLDVWARAHGGGFFNLSDPREFTGDRPETVQAVDLLHAMIWEDQSTVPAYRRQDFVTGDISLVEDGNHSVIDRFDRLIEGRFGWNIAPSPVGPYGRSAYSGDDGWGIWRDTRHPEEAWRFVKFLASKRGQEIAARIEGLAPVRKSAMPYYQELAPHINLGALFENMIDPGPPLTTLLVGDVANIASTLNGALRDVLEYNVKPWQVAAEEIKPIIERYARQ